MNEGLSFMKKYIVMFSPTGNGDKIAWLEITDQNVVIDEEFDRDHIMEWRDNIKDATRFLDYETAKKYVKIHQKVFPIVFSKVIEINDNEEHIIDNQMY